MRISAWAVDVALVSVFLVLAACSSGSPAGDVGVDTGEDWGTVDPTPDGLEQPGNCTGPFRIEDLDGNPAEAGPEGVDYLFDQTQLRTFELEMAPADWQWLQDNALKEIYAPAALVFEGRRYVGIGARFKGAWSTLTKCFDEKGNQICPKLSIKLRFDKYDDCGRFLGQRRLIFNSSSHDAAHMRERLMWGLMEKIGLMGSRSVGSRLAVNGGAFSFYSMVEAVDKEYLEERFDNSEGNLYKQVWPIHEDEWPYVSALRTNESAADVERMLEFAATIREVSDANFAKEVGKYTDLANIARMAAFARATGDDDGVLRFWCADMFSSCENHNYYWYDEPDKLIRLVPWDQDITVFGYQEKEEIAPEWWEMPTDCNPIPLWVADDLPPPESGTDELVLQPQCDRLLHQAVSLNRDAYVDTLVKMAGALVESQEDVEAYRAQIEPVLLEDPLKTITMEEWKTEVDWLKKKLGQQKAAIEALLAGE